MKNIYFLLFFFCISVPAQDFDKKWEKIISFEKEGKIKPAFTEVNSIQRYAEKQKNETQLLKCFFYKSKYMLVLEEDAQNKIISNLEAAISKSSPATKALLNLVYVKCLEDYKLKNYDSLYTRTKLDSTESGNFKTWSYTDFDVQINLKMQETLKDETVLQKTPLSNYEPVFDFLTLEKFKKESLFEYILRENIAFYKKRISPWVNEKAEIKITQDLLLGNSKEFVAADFGFIINPDFRIMLKLMQKLEIENPSLESEFERIQFVQKDLESDTTIYLKKLTSLQKKKPDNRLLQKILFEKAITYKSVSNNPKRNIQALALLDSVIAIPNRSNAYRLAVLEKFQIFQKSLSVGMEKLIYPKENTRASITFANVDKIKVYFFKIDFEESKNIQTHKRKDSIIENIRKTNPVKTLEHQFITKKDFIHHTSELLMPQLETGNYLVCFETDNQQPDEKSFVAKVITVTDFILLNETKNDNEVYRILNRKTGMPIEGVSLKSNFFDLKTDRNGQAFFKRSKTENYFQIEIAKGNDTIELPSNYYFYDYKKSSSNEDDDSDLIVNFYLDRDIFRPGQILYYKGIAFENKNDQTKLVTDRRLKIIVENAEEKEFKSFEVTTNKFGSFSGEFELPKTGLTGRFSITAEEPDITNTEEDVFWKTANLRSSYANKRFTVEEYKRPRFEVSFKPVKENYVLNQQVKIVGNAEAFSGSSISEAKVVYKITRSLQTKDWRDNESAAVFLNGETKTDASGNFTISFLADDSNLNPNKKLPVYNYEITADVTDLNGETHTAVKTVKVGYHSLFIYVDCPNEIDTKQKKSILLNTKNLNGEFYPAKGELKIYFLRDFQYRFKKSNWPKPQFPTISESDFSKLFPYEVYPDNSADSTEILVFSKKTDTGKSNEIPMDFSNYKPGFYKVVFSCTDKENIPVETTYNFIVKNSDGIDPEKLFTIKQLNENPKKDGFVKISVKSIIKELHLIASATFSNKLFFDGSVYLKNGQSEITIPLQPEFNNYCIVNFESIFENHYFSEQIKIDIQEIIPKITFETEVFRNRINPGSLETWSFKISPKDEAIQSEVLASMYDSSIDQFSESRWDIQDIFGNYYNGAHRRTVSGIEKTSFYISDLNQLPPKMVMNTETTKLLWFGFNINNIVNHNSTEYKKQLSRKSKVPANSKKITGIIEDSKLPLPGITITIPGTNRSTISDFDGYFEIQAAFGEMLEFSDIGYKTQKIKISSDSFKVNMEEIEASGLETVVINYGYHSKTVKKSASAVATLTQTDYLEEMADITILKNLQGQISGMNITGGAGQPGADSTIILRGVGSINGTIEPLFIVDGIPVDEDGFRSIMQSDIYTISILKDAAATSIYGNRGGNGVILITTKKGISELTKVKTRTNLQETAFFFPHLKTNSSGKLSFSFTSPEALSEWKFRLLAHNNNKFGYFEKKVITQKEIMITPNFPRFFRENDTVSISVKIANITKDIKSGIAMLAFTDATTGNSIDVKMSNQDNVKNFKALGFGNTSVNWKVVIPKGIYGIQYKVVAKSGEFSDGEENIIPVLTDNILVTETLPVWIRENSKKDFTIENLKNNDSKTLKNHSLTLEYTSNPAWVAIQSLPYLMEYEHECAEQTFARFYANAIASEIIESNPKIAEVFESWRKNDGNISKMEQNETLKSLLLAETPWASDAKSDAEKKRNLALLFDLEKMKSSLQSVFNKLKEKQKPSGGFAWFGDGNENEYITRHILAGFGHLQKLNIKTFSADVINPLAKKGIAFIDSKFLAEYDFRKKSGAKIITVQPQSELHYLYTRSFYADLFPLSEEIKTVVPLYLDSVEKNWLYYSLYEKGLAALTLHRFDRKSTAKKILENLKQTAANDDSKGMFWIENTSGYYWYKAPIETQALLIEAFSEINNDTKSVDAMKVWLLKNKQNKNWPATKSTTEAIYALLLQGSDWLSVKNNTFIQIGNEKIASKKLSENEKEAETGYIKINWNENEITKEMAPISIENKSKVPGYGGIYFQYFEDVDKIKSSSSGVLSVAKDLFLKKTTEKGDVLQKITSSNVLKVGDLVTVRLVISAKENVEFVHLKDMRASCFEPVDVLSKYDWKDGIGFYKSTKDAATHFFFDNINVGTYVLEYNIRVNNSGNFSNGITTIQSMYAPEFSSHTKGTRVNVN